MLKGASKPSLWLRNIQLACYSSVVAVGGLLLSSDESLRRNGWMAGFGLATWGCVFFQAMGGILVAVTIKYADNILRGFAQGLALIVGALGSWLFFGFQITARFVFGCSLVILAIFIYGSNTSSPADLLSFCPCYSAQSTALDCMESSNAKLLSAEEEAQVAETFTSKNESQQDASCEPAETADPTGSPKREP